MLKSLPMRFWLLFAFLMLVFFPMNFRFFDIKDYKTYWDFLDLTGKLVISTMGCFTGGFFINLMCKKLLKES